MTKKNWTRKEILYIKEYSGKYSNKYLAKKFNVSLNTIKKLQLSLDIKVKEGLVKHDCICKQDIINILGLTDREFKTLTTNLNIKLKNMGNIISVLYTDFEKLETFLNTYITTNQAKKMFTENITYGHIKKLEHKQLKEKGTIYINKKEVIEYKNLLNKSLSLLDFSKKVHYHKSYIFKKLGKDIDFFLDKQNNIRIPLTELTKFLK